MWKDPIVEEVREIRDLHAASFKYNLRAIFNAIKQEENESERHFISLPSKLRL